MCLYSGQVEEQDGTFVIEVPSSEGTIGAVESGAVTRVALLSPRTSKSQEENPDQQENVQWSPAAPGDQRTVDIEDLGEQGYGIARVECGYVGIIPDTEQGERVMIGIVAVQENAAFAEGVAREAYFEYRTANGGPWTSFSWK